MSVTTPTEELRSVDVSVRVDGTEYRGWQSVEVSRSLDDCASSWSVSGTLRWPGETVRRFYRDDVIQIRLGSDLVLTGYVDQITIPTGTATIQVSGRSKTADLVDCSAKNGRYDGLSLAGLAETLAAPYGVSVVVGVTDLDVGYRRPSWVKRGTTVFQNLEEQARRFGVLLTDDEQGRLCLLRAGTGRATTAIVVGQNVLPGGTVTIDSSQRYSVYKVRSQTAGDDQSYGAAVAQVDGEDTDEGMERYRLLVLDAAGMSRESCARRARWEAATRAGRSVTVSQSVRGWRQGDGRLWRTNEIVRYVDREAGLDADLLITAVRYTVDDGGQVTALTLVPRVAYDVLPPPRRGVGLWGDLKGGV